MTTIWVNDPSVLFDINTNPFEALDISTTNTVAENFNNSMRLLILAGLILLLIIGFNFKSPLYKLYFVVVVVYVIYLIAYLSTASAKEESFDQLQLDSVIKPDKEEDIPLPEGRLGELGVLDTTAIEQGIDDVWDENSIFRRALDSEIQIDYLDARDAQDEAMRQRVDSICNNDDLYCLNYTTNHRELD